MYIALATHAGPVPDAPQALTTLVAPARVTPEEAARGIAQLNSAPILRVAEYVLDYPGVSSDPAVAVEETVRRYTDCERCHLSDRRTKIVHVKGNPRAAVVAIGEGPGRDEDLQGMPFVGKSGRLQDELFRESGIDPINEIAWINLVGCRPCDSRHAPDRPPSLVEKAACSERTLMLLRGLRPRIVLCLGEQAATMFFEESHPNTWATLTPPDRPMDAVLVGVVRHPAYLLRTIGMPNTYREYAAARLFYRALREMMTPTLQKVAVWSFGLRYLATITGPMVGPDTRG